MSTSDDAFAVRTTAVLQSVGGSLRSVATEIGVSHGYLSQVASGKTMPSLKMIVAFREHYSISLDWYLRGVGPMRVDQGADPPPAQIGYLGSIHDLLAAAMAVASPDERTTVRVVLEGIAGRASSPRAFARSA